LRALQTVLVACVAIVGMACIWKGRDRSGFVLAPSPLPILSAYFARRGTKEKNNKARKKKGKGTGYRAAALDLSRDSVLEAATAREALQVFPKMVPPRPRRALLQHFTRENGIDLWSGLSAPVAKPAPTSLN